MNDMVQIPYIVYESMQTKNERTTKRLIFVVLLTVVLLFASNALWLYVWMQYDYESTDETTTYEYSQDGEGYNNINTGTQGDVSNGADLDDYDSTEETQEKTE